MTTIKATVYFQQDFHSFWLSVFQSCGKINFDKFWKASFHHSNSAFAPTRHNHRKIIVSCTEGDSFFQLIPETSKWFVWSSIPIMEHKILNQEINTVRPMQVRCCSSYTLKHKVNKVIHSTKGYRSKCRSSNLLRWLIYLIDLVVDNLFLCFTFPPTQQTLSFETKSPIVL